MYAIRSYYDVAAGHEGLLSGAGDQDHVDVVTLLQELDDRTEFPDGVGAQGVHRLGAVDGYGSYVITSYSIHYTKLYEPLMTFDNLLLEIADFIATITIV